jgi:DNA-binding NtrC family response regulator
MPPSDAAALLLEGRFEDALRSITETRTRRPLTAAEDVLLAELLALTGDTEQVLSLAERVVQNSALNVSQSCKVRLVLGRSHFRKGESKKGLEHYATGIRLAEHHGEFASECQLRVNLFRSQLNWLGPHQASTDLGSLRRKVLHLADVTTTTLFQLALAEFAAKLGLVMRARRHLETARSLGALANDKALIADVKGVEIAMAAMEANFGEALDRALELESIGRETGYASKSTIPINLAHLLTIAARFDEAAQVLADGTPHIFSGAGQIPMLDTLLQLRLFQNDLREAEIVSTSIQQLIDRTDSADSYFGLWYLLNRVKLLYKLGMLDEGLRLAFDTLPRIRAMADRNLLERMTLRAAEGYELLGNRIEGAALVASFWSLNAEPTLDVLAEAARITGKLSAADDRTNALEHLELSKIIFGHIGNLAALRDVESDLDVVTRSADSDSGAHSPALTSRIATIVELGAHPAVLAKQTFSLIKDSGSVLEARLVATHTDGRRQTITSYTVEKTGALPADDEPVRLAVGADRGWEYEITAVLRPTASARLLVVAIQRLIKSALSLAHGRQQERENAVLWPDRTEQELGLIASSERMLELVKTIKRVAGSNLLVLLAGETGVGKELFARAVHQASNRSDKTFLPFNCSTVPRDMFDSQLFGHKRGSFTGAHEDSAGVIRAAAGGTLFLDEIGEMGLDVQPKLLRFLESGEVQPLGDPKPRLVDVRVVAATNAKLDQLVAEGRFREDLFYRLNVIRIDIPPLRERREEIPALVEHFLEKFGREFEKPMLRVADETLEYLVLYRWPGNVRQLANEVRRMVALAEPGSVLMPAHLSNEIFASRKTIPVDQAPRGSSEVIARLDQPLSAAVEHVERAAIQRALSMTHGHMDEAARMLGLSRKGLYLKRQRLHMD